MTGFGGAIRALAADALRHVEDGQVVGLGSGRAAAAFVEALSGLVGRGGASVRCVPTSLQIKIAAERGGIPLVGADQVDRVDVAFDGADQIDARGFMIKGGGGALLRENILISSARKVVIMADRTKFSRALDRPVPVEVHPLARGTAGRAVREMGGSPSLRTLGRGYPFVTENGNLVMDCDFGRIDGPAALRRRLSDVAGVAEVGLFARRPDVAYRALGGGRFDVLRWGARGRAPAGARRRK